MRYKRAIVNFIKNYQDKNKISPTVREIALGVGISIGNTHRYLTILRRAGIVDWQDGLSRTLIVTKPGW